MYRYLKRGALLCVYIHIYVRTRERIFDTQREATIIRSETKSSYKATILPTYVYLLSRVCTYVCVRARNSFGNYSSEARAARRWIRYYCAHASIAFLSLSLFRCRLRARRRRKGKKNNLLYMQRRVFVLYSIYQRVWSGARRVGPFFARAS